MNLQTPITPGDAIGPLAHLELLSTHSVGTIELAYWLDSDSGRVQLSAHPLSRRDELATHRGSLKDVPEMQTLPWPAGAAWSLDSLVQLKIRGDAYPGGFVSGLTMRDSPSVAALRFETQNVAVEGEKTTISTVLVASGNNRYRVQHDLWFFAGENGFRTAATFYNDGDTPLDLELLSSFHLGGLSPFSERDEPNRLVLHRARSFWSAEGRFSSEKVEDLGLEPAWAPFSFRVEKFGTIGSMPVRGWFPFVAVEDTIAGVVWGAQLAWHGSWQIEVARRDDFLSICGGLADREYGHWMKTVAPGEHFTSPSAILSCVSGDLDDFCHEITNLGRRALLNQPTREREMPIVCNDWCTHWADTNHEKIVAMARRLSGTPVKTLVIDDGWQDRPGEGMQMIGDWNVHPVRFPDLKNTCDEIRAAGLVPGIWFEFESCTQTSAAWNETDHFLHRDGAVLQVGGRRFWDLRDGWTRDYLGRKVIGLLRDCGFGYLKVDYNDSIGWGVDGAESAGEGLRAHLEAVREFFERIRRELPDLVIENCSSGGHRLVPNMLEICAQASFSDAHESPEIPIIAANLHRLMLPQQNQIWAVLHANDSQKRLVYSLAAGFLGRLCLSGEIAGLSEAQMELVNRAMAFYDQNSHLIRDGKTRRFGLDSSSYRHPSGYQAVRFETPDKVLVVIHTFAQNAAQTLEIPLPHENWTISGQFSDENRTFEIESGTLKVEPLPDFAGVVVSLARQKVKP
ncbi:MAG TPA: glycoside hydrolase family 36 protein [Abditibacterium sp.]|jgi:alpha-galactosidase